jgi:hypothetical protein
MPSPLPKAIFSNVFLEPAHHSQQHMGRRTLLSLLPMFPNESQFDARSFFASQTSGKTRRQRNAREHDLQTTFVIV